MSTYPTYQAAKIANPDSNIYRYLSVSPLFTCESECNGFSLQPANPADYCMTVKQFLDAGHKFVDGDFMLGQDGLVVRVSNCPSYNMPLEDDDKRYALRTKSLEEANTIPTETPEDKEALDEKTYRYEKVTDSIEKIAKAMIDGEVFYSQGGSDRFYWRLNGFGKNNLALTGLNGFDFYRRIEVTERELEIEAAKDLYDTYMLIWSNHYIAWDSLDDKNKKAFLAIVCKTGYRKDFNVVNGKG